MNEKGLSFQIDDPTTPVVIAEKSKQTWLSWLSRGWLGNSNNSGSSSALRDSPPPLGGEFLDSQSTVPSENNTAEFLSESSGNWEIMYSYFLDFCSTPVDLNDEQFTILMFSGIITTNKVGRTLNFDTCRGI